MDRNGGNYESDSGDGQKPAFEDTGGNGYQANYGQDKGDII